MKVSTAIILDKRSQNTEGGHPVKLRVMFQKQKKLYPVKYSPIPDYETKRDGLPERLKFSPGQAMALSEKDYSAVFGKGSREPYGTLRVYFNDYLKIVRATIERIHDFDFDKTAYPQ